jgi:hypothetical protein
MNDKVLDTFGPTIRTWWNAQNPSLKKYLIDHMVGLFGDCFKKIGVTSLVDTYLKYVRDQYRFHLQTNPRYEHPPMIPKSEWKNILEDEKENTMRKEGKMPPGPGSYIIF